MTDYEYSGVKITFQHYIFIPPLRAEKENQKQLEE